MLHVGCGALEAKLPPMFLGSDWREIRVTPTLTSTPISLADLTDMHVISDGLVDAVYSSAGDRESLPARSATGFAGDAPGAEANRFHIDQPA